MLLRVLVAPYAGAWIEIEVLKKGDCENGVAPYAGAWIEIRLYCSCVGITDVAPYAGAWIEIDNSRYCRTDVQSLPTRERGLKFAIVAVLINELQVAPYAGAWIEIA